MAWLKGRSIIFWANGGFVGLALLLSLPLLRPDRLIGADYEGSLSFWAVWFAPHALQHNYDLSYNFYSLYPAYTNWLPYLSLPSSFFYSLLKIPLGPTLAYNALIPLYLALTGLCGYAFYRLHSPDRRGLPIIAGMLLAFNPLTYEWAKAGAIPLLGLFGFPLVMLLWNQWLARFKTPWLVAMVLASYGVVLLSVQYWNLLLTLVLPYALLRLSLWWQKASAEDKRQWTDAALMALLGFAILFLVFPASALLWSSYYLRYEPLQVWQGMQTPSGWEWNILVYGGLLSLLAALALPWETSPNRRWWMFIFALNLLLYFRPQLAPLTFIGELFRVPHNPILTQASLFLIPIILSGSVLVMQGLGVLLRWVDYNPAMPYAVYLLLGGGIIWGSGWWQALPTSPLPPVPYYAHLADEPENYLVVNFPLGADSLARRTLAGQGKDTSAYPAFNFDSEAGRIMAYAPQHHKRILGGFLPTLSEEDILAYQSSPLVKLLSFELERSDTAQIIELRREVVRWRAAYVVIRQGIVPPEFENALRGWMRWTDTFCELHQADGLAFWRASWHPAGCPAYEIRLGAEEGELALGEGWHGAEYWDRPVRWAGNGQTSSLTLWISAPATDYQLSIQAQSTADISAQSVEVIANGQSLGQIALESDWATYSLILPRLSIAEGGKVELELRHSQENELNGRSLTAVYDFIRVEKVEP